MLLQLIDASSLALAALDISWAVIPSIHRTYPQIDVVNGFLENILSRLERFGVSLGQTFSYVQGCQSPGWWSI